MTEQYQQPTGSTGQQTYGGPTGQQTYGGQTGQQTYGGQTGQQPTGMQTEQRPSRMRMTQQPTGRWSGRSHRTTHEQVGQQFESELTDELNEALESFDRVVEIAEWCADKCIESGPQMADCARLCEDVADIASLNEKLIARDSINGPEVAETFLRVAEQGLPVLQQHQQSPHVQETYQAVTQAMDATERLLDSIGGYQSKSDVREQGQQQGRSFQQPQGQTFKEPQGQSQSFEEPQQRSFRTTQPY